MHEKLLGVSRADIGRAQEREKRLYICFWGHEVVGLTTRLPQIYWFIELSLIRTRPSRNRTVATQRGIERERCFLCLILPPAAAIGVAHARGVKRCHHISKGTN